jgi:hypothetical protein
MKIRILLLFVLLACVAAVAQRRTIPGDTEIRVRTDTAIPANPAVGTTYSASVSEDVPDGQGGIAIPRGSRARLITQSAPDGRDTVLDLRSVTVSGTRYNLEAAGTQGTRSSGSGLGANQRTAKYVGGGAAIGAVLGAILGGGKGAAIGAIVGGAGGAGAQVVTGRKKGLPAETQLTYRTAQPLTMRAAAAAARRNSRTLQRRPPQ